MICTVTCARRQVRDQRSGPPGLWCSVPLDLRTDRNRRHLAAMMLSLFLEAKLTGVHENGTRKEKRMKEATQNTTLVASSIYHPLYELLLAWGLPMQKITRGQKKTWIVGQEMVWTRGDVRVTVPVNFSTDFASTPFFLRWWVRGTDGAVRVASVFHDMLFSGQSGFGWWASNRIFRQVMQYQGVRFTKRWALWAGVASPFGWWAYRSSQEEFAKEPDWRMYDKMLQKLLRQTKGAATG